MEACETRALDLGRVAFRPPWRIALVVAAVGIRLVQGAASGLRGAELRASPVGVQSLSYALHGQDWRSGQCHSGQAQSPIDLPAATTQATLDFGFLYKDDASQLLSLYHTGTALALDTMGSVVGGLLLDSVWYDLLNVNIHVSSEHTWAGQSHMAELHFVHQSSVAPSAILVAAVALEVSGTAPAAPLDGAAPATPAPARGGGAAGLGGFIEPLSGPAVLAPGERIALVGVGTLMSSINSLFDGFTFFEYSGSTTAPPCAEGIRWLVRTTPASMSLPQASRLRDLIFAMTAGAGNNRAVMPLANRTLLLRSGVQLLPHATTLAGFHADSESPSPRAREALLNASVAMQTAGLAARHAQDLLARSRLAAQAEVKRLAALGPR